MACLTGSLPFSSATCACAGNTERPICISAQAASKAILAIALLQLAIFMYFAFREPTDVRSNFERHRQSQKFPLPACRVMRAHLYTAIGWHSVPPKEEEIRVYLPSRPESISAARVHVEVGKAGSRYPSR